MESERHAVLSVQTSRNQIVLSIGCMPILVVNPLRPNNERFTPCELAGCDDRFYGGGVIEVGRRGLKKAAHASLLF